MIALRAAIALEVRLLLRDPAALMVLYTQPLVCTILLAIFFHSDRADLAEFAIVGSSLMAVFQLALFTSSEILTRDRAAGTLELTVASPSSLSVVFFGRILVVTLVSLIAFAEAAVIGAIAGVSMPVEQPSLLVLALLVTGFATSATGFAFGAALLRVRWGRTLQNSLAYPVFVFSGLLFPVTVLPDFVQPLTKASYLTWAGELLRDVVGGAPQAWAGQAAAVLGLGGATLVLGILLLRRSLRRAQAEGSLERSH